MKRLILGLGSLPFLAHVALFGYAIYVANLVGHWPTYGNPDPSDVPWKFLSAVFAVSTVGSYFLILILPLIFLTCHLISHHRSKSHDWLRLPWAAYLAGTVVWGIDFYILHHGSGSLANWILD